MNVYYAGIFANLGVNILGALSVYVINKSGQISVGNAGFMAVGAYTAAILSSVYGATIPAAVLCGGVMAGIAGVLVGVPVLRLRGTYLVIATISFTAMIRSLAQIMTITGGAQGFRGIQKISIGCIFAFTVLVIVLLYLFERTRMGLSVCAVAAQEAAAGAAGVHVKAVKISAFAAGACIAGISGGCYAHWAQYIEPSDFSTMVSTMMVLPVILGGRHRIMGAVIGAMIFTLLPELLRFAYTWRMVIYGCIVIVTVIMRPDGLIGTRRHIATKEK